MQVQKSHGVSLIYLMKGVLSMNKNEQTATMYESCLLYTSDAADD